MGLIIILAGLFFLWITLRNAHNNEDFNDEYKELLDSIHESKIKNID